MRPSLRLTAQRILKIVAISLLASVAVITIAMMAHTVPGADRAGVRAP
jgi:hypothetical protein